MLYDTTRKGNENTLLTYIFINLFAANSKVILHITDGGQRNVEDAIHHAMPVFGVSYTSTVDHYLYQVEKFECGLVSFIDFDSQNEIENKLEEILNSKRWEFWSSRNPLINSITLLINVAHENETKIHEKCVYWPESMNGKK